MGIYSRSVKSLIPKFGNIEIGYCPAPLISIFNLLEDINEIQEINKVRVSEHNYGFLNMRKSQALKLFDSSLKQFKLAQDELISMYDTFKKAYIAKSHEALTQNKKILVIIGETHAQPNSELAEIIILHYLNKVGYKKLMVEFNQAETREQAETNTEAPISNFAKQILKWQIIPIDTSLKKGFYHTNNKDHDERNSDMVSNVINSAGSDSVIIIGAWHIQDFIKNKEFNNRFVTLKVDVSENDGIWLSPEGISKMKAYKKYLLSEGVLTLKFTQLLSSLSLYQMFSMYEDIKAFFESEKSKNENKLYTSDFANNLHSCPMIDEGDLMGIMNKLKLHDEL